MKLILNIAILMLPVAVPFFLQPVVMDRAKKPFFRILPLLLLEAFPVVKIVLGNTSGTSLGMDEAFFYTIIALEILFGWAIGWLVGKLEK